MTIQAPENVKIMNFLELFLYNRIMGKMNGTTAKNAEIVTISRAEYE